MGDPTAPPPPADVARQRAKQKRTLVLLASGLIGAGLVVLLVVERMPLPLRILLGLTDIVAGAVLLIVARQKFSA